MVDQTVIESRIQHDWINLRNECLVLVRECEKKFFDIGDKALVVEAEYGKKNLKRFAEEIKLASSTLRLYKSVAEFYRDDKVRYGYPVLTFAHFAAAKKDNTPEQATKWLDRAMQEKLSVRDLRFLIAESRGEKVEKFFSIRLPEDLKENDKVLMEHIDWARQYDDSIPEDEIGKREWLQATNIHLFEQARIHDSVRALMLTVNSAATQREGGEVSESE